MGKKDKIIPFNWANANKRNRVELGLNKREFKDAEKATEALWQFFLHNSPGSLDTAATERWDYIIRITLDTLKTKLWGGAQREE